MNVLSASRQTMVPGMSPGAGTRPKDSCGKPRPGCLNQTLIRIPVEFRGDDESEFAIKPSSF